MTIEERLERIENWVGASPNPEATMEDRLVEVEKKLMIETAADEISSIKTDRCICCMQSHAAESWDEFAKKNPSTGSNLTVIHEEWTGGIGLCISHRSQYEHAMKNNVTVDYYGKKCFTFGLFAIVPKKVAEAGA